MPAAERQPSRLVAHHPRHSLALIDEQRVDGRHRAGPQASLETNRGEPARGRSLQHVRDLLSLEVALIVLEDLFSGTSDRAGARGVRIDCEGAGEAGAQMPRKEV